jgi:hypothetical protein
VRLAILAWIAWSMLDFCPTSNFWRITSYGPVASAVLASSSSPADWIDLTSIGGFESGYDTRARGKKGEVGVWQLMRPFPCHNDDLPCQARVALERWKAGECLYTGEDWQGDCPMARLRGDRATIWLARHPPPAPP